MTHVSFISVQRGRCFRWCRSYVTSCSGQTRIASFTTSCLRPNLFKRSFVFTAWTVHRLWNSSVINRLLCRAFDQLTLYGHIKTTEQRNWPLYSSTVIGGLLHLVQRGGTWAVGRAAARPVVAVSHPTHQHKVYQLHIIWCSTIASGL